MRSSHFPIAWLGSLVLPLINDHGNWIVTGFVASFRP